MENLENKNNSINDELVKEVVKSCGYKLCYEKTEEARAQVSQSYEDLKLSNLSVNYIKDIKKISELWRHQYIAVKKAKEGKNVCVTTSTSSGKSEIFILSALELLARDPEAKILAVYPMKALNRQQVNRWEEAYESVGKIDGDTRWIERLSILKNKRVVVMTPDVIHAWLLDNINNSSIGEVVCNFISSISLVIIDELHLYKGLFGTNSAYLFRRLNNVRRLLRKSDDIPQYITASATLPNACDHSFKITGARNFEEIGLEVDGSSISKKTFYFVEQDGNGTNANVNNLVKEFSKIEGTKSITFVESRQKTGALVSEIDKQGTKGIFAYRAGYEVESSNIIAESLNKGDFKGVISTSALEIGINIEGLNICIIADMPHDKNSFQQRIGRVGRGKCDNSYVIVVKNDRSLPSKLLFENFNYDIDKVLPNYEPALYIEDTSVQCVQALIHVGEHDYCEYAKWKGRINEERKFNGGDLFPESFVELCNKVLNGQAPKEYKDTIRDSSSNPQLAYTLRHFGKQFTIKPAEGSESELPADEKISREQIVTEGYPKAIRYTYMGGQKVCERIINVFNSENKLIAEKNRNANKTNPNPQSYVIPNFDEGQRHGTIKFGDCTVFNLELGEHKTVFGYYETTRDGNTTYYTYEKNGLAEPYRLPMLETTGTIIFHPSFNDPGVKVDEIADILFETFLRLKAFDRNDISHKGSRLYSNNNEFPAGTKFVALYDSNKLNITKNLLDESMLKDLMGYIKQHMDIVISTLCPNISNETRASLSVLCESVLKNEPVKEFVEIIQQPIRCMSKVIYRMPPIGGQQETTADCIFLGLGNQKGTCNLMFDNNRFLNNVPLDCIETTSETIFDETV